MLGWHGMPNSVKESSVLNLAEAQKNGRIDEFIAQQEAAGVRPHSSSLSNIRGAFTFISPLTGTAQAGREVIVFGVRVAALVSRVRRQGKLDIWLLWRYALARRVFGPQERETGHQASWPGSTRPPTRTPLHQDKRLVRNTILLRPRYIAAARRGWPRRARP